MNGCSPGELVTTAKNLADCVAKGLMSKYGCVLGEGVINKHHDLDVDDSVANLLNQYFTVSTPKRVIDYRPREDEREIDNLGFDAAIEYLMVPESIKGVERQLATLSCNLEKIDYFLENLITILGKLCKHQCISQKKFSNSY